MALGKKSQPAGYFEVGDLLFMKAGADAKTYSNPRLKDYNGVFVLGDTTDFSTDSTLLGVIRATGIKDKDYTENYIEDWIEFKNTSNKIAYIELDSSILFSNSNPEFNYPDTAKKNGWQAILTSGTAILNSLLSLFGKKQTEADTAESETVETDQEAEKVPTGFNWKTWGIVGAIVVLLITIIVLLFKKKPEVQPYRPIPIRLPKPIKK